MAKGLTERQRSVLEHIIDFQKQNGFPPTIRELGDALGIKSLRGVTVHLDALALKGFLTRARSARSIRITAPDPRGSHHGPGQEVGVPLPLVKDPAPGAGAAAPSEAQVERYVCVPEELAALATPAGFVIRVGAAGVPGEPIVPGDLVLIRPQQSPAAPGELVAVDVGGGIGIRRARAEGGGAAGTAVLGRVVGLLRRY